MENQLMEKENLTKNITTSKKDKIIKNRINLISLDKFKDVYNPNITKNNPDYNDNNDINLNIKNIDQEKKIDNNKNEKKKIELKMPGETIHKRKIIDYILLSKKNPNRKNINIKSKEIEKKKIIL